LPAPVHHPSGATVRIYLLSYRRPRALQRAIESLRAQTFRDWICELHNDAPDDPAPEEIVRALNDPRIQLQVHEKNLGAVATFNLAHKSNPEPFFSLLEDDNWWEPTFLERLLDLLAAHPSVEMAWSNMKFWREEKDGQWTDLHTTIWPRADRPSFSFAWPQLLQFDTALYSNGAMVARTPTDGHLQTSNFAPVDVMESLRDRAFSSPTLLVTEPLANFALTRETARSGQRSIWLQTQALLGAAFLQHVAMTRDQQARLWSARRSACPAATPNLFFAGFIQPTRGWFSHATAGDWLRFIAGCVRRPGLAWTGLRARIQRPELWAEIQTATAAACARPQGGAEVPPLALARRADLIDQPR
jgi:hypothetical protein